MGYTKGLENTAQPRGLCGGVSVGPPTHAHAPRPHALKPSKYFMMRNLCNDLPRSPLPSVPSVHSHQLPVFIRNPQHHWAIAESLSGDGWHTLWFQALLALATPLLPS